MSVFYNDIVVPKNNYVNYKAFSCLFVNDSDVWFGALKDGLSFDVEIPQDLDMDFLWIVVLPVLVTFQFILSSKAPMQMRDPFIMAAKAFHKRKGCGLSFSISLPRSLCLSDYDNYLIERTEKVFYGFCNTRWRISR